MDRHSSRDCERASRVLHKTISRSLQDRRGEAVQGDLLSRGDHSLPVLIIETPLWSTTGQTLATRLLSITSAESIVRGRPAGRPVADLHLSPLALRTGVGCRDSLCACGSSGLATVLRIRGWLPRSDSLESVEHATLSGNWESWRHWGSEAAGHELVSRRDGSRSDAQTKKDVNWRGRPEPVGEGPDPQTER
jgi:hypothetical protein